MQLDIKGQLIEINVPETVSCTACDGHAERLSSAYQGKGVAYHNYQCHIDGCPAAGTIVEHDSGEYHGVGPVFRAPRTHRPARRDDHPASLTRGPDHERERELPTDEPPEVSG